MATKTHKHVRGEGNRRPGALGSSSRFVAAIPGRGSRRAGLTLVEVLISLVILTTGLFVMISTAAKCLSVARQAKNYEKARHLLGRVELENPLQLEEEIEEGTDSGSFKGEPGSYHWTRTIALESEEEEDALYRVTTRVYWSDRGKEAFEEVVSLLHAPQDKQGGSFERSAP